MREPSLPLVTMDQVRMLVVVAMVVVIPQEYLYSG